MEYDKFEFRAPQYWVDLCPELESPIKRVEDSNTSFGAELDKITSEYVRKSEEQKYSLFQGLKTGERGLSDKRSSVLCERLEDNHSYMVKQDFLNSLDNMLNSPVKTEVSRATPTRKQKIAPKVNKPGAYLFSVKTKLKTPRKCRNVLREIIDNIEGDTSTCDLDEKFSLNYAGLGTIKAQNRFTVAQPFSFHERDEEFLRRKKEKMQKAQEEVIKIPEFHARPVPPYILCNNMSKLNLSVPNRNVKKVSPQGGKILKAKVPEDLRNSVKKRLNKDQ